MFASLQFASIHFFLLHFTSYVLISLYHCLVRRWYLPILLGLPPYWRNRLLYIALFASTHQQEAVSALAESDQWNASCFSPGGKLLHECYGNTAIEVMHLIKKLSALKLNQSSQNRLDWYDSICSNKYEWMPNKNWLCLNFKYKVMSRRKAHKNEGNDGTVQNMWNNFTLM